MFCYNRQFIITADFCLLTSLMPTSTPLVKTPNALPCPFLDALSPSQLTKLLASDDAAQTIWLHNGINKQDNKSTNYQTDAINDQGVIGIFPKISWTVYPTNQADYFCMVKATKKHTTKSHVSYNEFSDVLAKYCEQQNTLASQHPLTKVQQQPNYYNGLMGFIGYDMSAHALSHEVAIKPDQPCAFFGHYDVYLTCTVNKDCYQWQLNAATQNAYQKQQKVFSWLSQLTISKAHTAPLTLSLQPVWQLSHYQNAFAKTQDYLYAGDCYQINLTQAWQGKLDTKNKLADYLPNLHTHTNAPFAGYLTTKSYEQFSKFELLSCSPELFFTFNQDKDNQYEIITKPIKGTRPRGNNPLEDDLLKTELAHSEKDTAENVMIVDLLRNDLGKYAQTGSVNVPTLFAIESYSNVHHMVSTITAKLKNDTHPIKVLFGSLPAGSITGTPKKRAVEIIHELENQPIANLNDNCHNNQNLRGAYCGTMGYLNFNGNGQWNVLIRTLQSCSNTVNLWAGGGITIASDCDAEYQECFDKVGNIVDILANPTKL